ncbi:universal stress protein [Streptomyces sp. NPDC048002]|uniref:universal stress protein n=1 Tax=unclassified Streptomyces TaxID=2593676 RepID=UPI00340E10A4
MTSPYVVVGVDGSLAAVRALDRAAQEAARREAVLRIVYAVRDRDEAGPVLGAAVTRVHACHPELRVESRTAVGGAVAGLVGESRGAVLTVVGSRGLGTVSGVLARSVGLGLAAQLRGPLLVVRGDHRCDASRAVLLGLAGDSDAAPAAHAFEEAERRGVGLEVAHCWAHRFLAPELPSLIPATSPGQRANATTGRSEDAVPRFSLAGLRDRHPGVPVEARTLRTGPGRTLLAATRDSSVVVIGARHHHGRLGPVAHTLLRRSHCPVLLVPTP